MDESEKYHRHGAYHIEALRATRPWRWDAGYALRYRFAMDAIARAGARTVLDLGCGDGALALALARGGARVVALDAVPIAVVLLRERLPAAFALVAPCVGDARALPLRDAAVDAVAALDVLEHLDEHDAERAVREARRVLRPGGLVVVTVPRATPGLGGKPEGSHHARELDGTTLAALLGGSFADVCVRGAVARAARMRASRIHARSRLVRAATSLVLIALGARAFRTDLLPDDPAARFLVATARAR